MKQKQKGFTVIEILIGLVAIAGITFGGYLVYQHSHKATKLNTDTAVPEINPESLPTALPTDLLSVDKITQLATAQKPDLTVSKIELDKEKGSLVYKVELSDGSKLAFNAVTGAQVTTDKNSADDSNDGDLPEGSKVAITFDQARAAAQAQKPDGTINKIKLDGEDGKPVYKVTFTDGTKIFISAIDASVVRVRVEGDNKSNTPGADKGSAHKSDSKDSGSESGQSGDTGGSGGSGGSGDGGGSGDSGGGDTGGSGGSGGSGGGH